MSYETATRESYSFLDATFGATSVVHNIIGPKGHVGFVRDIMVDVATSLVGTTTVPEIDVGISSGDTTYGRYRLGTAVGTGLGTGVARASQEAALTGNPPRTLADFAGHVMLDGGPLSGALPAGRIPKDTALVITNKAGVGGTPAGGGLVTVVIDWIGKGVQ